MEEIRRPTVTVSRKEEEHSVLIEESPVNALLIYPQFSDTFWSFKYALRFIRKRPFAPPLAAR